MFYLVFFFMNLFSLKKLKRIILYFIYIILAIIVLIIINTEKYYYQFVISEIIILTVPLIIYSFIYFIKKIDSKDKRFIYFNSGFFIYLTCSTLLFSAGNIESDLKYLLWNVNTTLYAIFQLLILLEWYKDFIKQLS